MGDLRTFDAIIIGGSYAGLSAAMSLGRSTRRTLVIDSGKPCNRQTPHSHNFLTQDGNTPAAIAALSRSQVEKYPSVQFHEGLVLSGKKTEDGFAVSTEAGASFSAKRLVFASGIIDEMPDIDGFAECWGISVIHCPYCHGYEFRKQKTGIMANGERAFHLAPLVRNLTDQLIIFTNGEADFSEEQISRLRANDVQIIEKTVKGIKHENGQINHVIFHDDSHLELEALYAAIPFKQHTDVPRILGCELAEHGFIQVDEFQKTTVDGIFACGDNTTPMRSVAGAVNAGNKAGAVVNMELSQQEF